LNEDEKYEVRDKERERKGEI